MPNTYPSLSVAPRYPIPERRQDPTIRSPFEAGYVLTRRRYTRSIYEWEISYYRMPTADKNTLNAFVSTVGGGADAFDWTHPETASVHTVRFKIIPEYEADQKGRWNVRFTLETL
jgi:hypothetical protein